MPASLPIARILRARLKLDPFEVHALLRGLPEVLDADDEWQADPSRLSSRLTVRWLGAADPPEQLAASPMKQWPPVQIDIVTQATRCLADEGVTMRPGEMRELDAAVRLAALVFELLGGPVDSLGRLRFSPLPMLNEAGNGALQAALSGGRRHRDCRAFWNCWAESLDPAQRATPVGMIRWRPHRVSEPNSAETGTALDLIPEAASAPAIRVVAHREFRMGRSRSLSDLPLRADEGEMVGQKTKRLSRVHVTWRPPDGLVDGNGITASGNGSTYEGQALSPLQPRAVAPRGSLVLADELELTAIAAPSPGPWPWLFQDEREVAGVRPLAPESVGMLRFETVEGRRLPREALWIEREIGMITGPSGIVWTLDPCARAVWFAHHDGLFFVANPGLAPEEVSLDGAPLAPGEMSRLQAGQPLAIGGLRWGLKIG